MTTDAPETVPVRRVAMTVTGYLRHGHPAGGFYDMQTAADGGMGYSIPESEVDEASVKDAPPEILSADDWNEIGAHVTARYGSEAGGRLLAEWTQIAAAFDAAEAGRR